MSSNYVYQTRSRGRTKIDRLATDVDVPDDHHPDLAAELSDVIGEQVAPR